ncbi:MAG: YceI family protein [Bacteroidetes bacterium]|nr:YceI family protein [Bacteroidota bacterium]
MKNLALGFLCLLLISSAGFTQKFITKTGHIKFFSESPMEKIEAHNHQVKAGLDVSTGDMQFIVLMKSFEFAKALMQEHFNENYVESDKFPNATFTGKVTNIKDVNTAKNGVYEALVEGKLTIHGISQQVKEKGSIEVTDGKINAKARFNILLSNYNIKIPGAVSNNISKSVEITVEMILDKLN